MATRLKTPKTSSRGFFEHLIGSRGLATVDRSKGRFRSFLLASFQNFMAAEARRERAEKRGGRAQLIRLDWRDAEARLVFEPEDRLTPETLYDVRYWHCCFCAVSRSAFIKNKTGLEKERSLAP